MMRMDAPQSSLDVTLGVTTGAPLTKALDKRSDEVW